MGEGVTSHDSLVRLDRHTHKSGDRMGGLVEHPGHDIRIYRYVLAAFHGHHHLFHGSVAGPLAYTVDSHLDLTGSVHHPGKGICRSHTEIIVAMGGDYGLVYVGDIVDQILYLGSVLFRKTVTGSVRDIHHCRPGRYHSLDHPCKVLVLRPAGIFCIELHIIHIFPGIFHRRDRPLQNLFPV